MPGAAQPLRLPIQERFVSIQGEGLWVGVPSSFVRVSGCNLRCTWCDSPATSWEPSGAPQTLDEIVAFCAQGPEHVVLTGGEPLLFKPLAPLSQALHRAGHTITIETAGTTLVPELHCDLMSISPKLRHSIPWHRDPSWASRHDERRWQPGVVRELMRYPWQLKFVVRANVAEHLAEDLEEIETMLETLEVSPSEHDRVLLMPECIEPERLTADYRALTPRCLERGFRLGLRLHITLFGHTPGT